MDGVDRADGRQLIPKHGGYRKLKSFQVAQLAYDVTVVFCNRYVDRRSRTHDQMVQAAHSGVQNIFLRQRGLPVWAANDPRRSQLIAQRPATVDDVAQWARQAHQDKHNIVANAALTLISVACSLLDRQLAAQAAAFEREGGFTERLYRIRSGKKASG